MRSINPKLLSLMDRYQLKILIETVRYPDCWILGGPTESEAKQILKSKFNYSDNEIKEIKLLNRSGHYGKEDDNFLAVIEDLKNKGIQNTTKLFADIEEQLSENPDMVRELIKDYVKTYDVDDLTFWIETQGKNIEDYK